MPALVLAEIERRSGRPCVSLFDLIAGTSTGGIIACGLAAGLPASELVDLYGNRGPEIFSKDLGREVWEADGLRGPRYDAGPLESIMQQMLGEKLLSSVGTRLVVPCSRCDAQPLAFQFKSSLANDPDLDFPLWAVARATSAAPTYFRAAVITSQSGKPMTAVDGGLWANNPSACAVIEANRLWPGEPLEILSLGTGGPFSTVPVQPDWGGIDWLPYVIEYMMQLSEQSAASMASGAPGSTFERLDPKFSANMDDARLANIVAMRSAAAAMIAAGSDILDKFSNAAAA